MAAQEGAGQIGVHHLVPFRQCVFLRLLADVDAGVVDQDIEPPVGCLTAPAIKARHESSFNTSTAMALALGAEIVDLLHRGFVLRCVASCHDNRRAGCGHALRHAEANATIATRNDGHAAGKIEQFHCTPPASGAICIANLHNRRQRNRKLPKPLTSDNATSSRLGGRADRRAADRVAAVERPPPFSYGFVRGLLWWVRRLP